MSDLATYSVADFIPYDLTSANRLVELANAGLWPLHLLAIVLAAIIMAALFRNGARVRHRMAVACLALAAAWLCVGFGYQTRYLSQLLWIAPQFALASYAQATVLAIAAIVLARRSDRGSSVNQGCGRVGRPVAVAIGFWAIAVHPAIGYWLADRAWQGMSWFAIMPLPTAMVSVALAWRLPLGVALIVSIVPVLVGVAALITAWVLQSIEAGASVGGAVLVGLAAAIFERRSRLR